MAAFGCAKLPGFDVQRIITSSRALARLPDGADPGDAPDPRRRQVCFQNKNALEINEVYGLRAKLHRQVYQHRTANVAEAMITDMFIAAEPSFRMRGAPSAAHAADANAADADAADADAADADAAHPLANGGASPSPTEQLEAQQQPQPSAPSAGSAGGPSCGSSRGSPLCPAVRLSEAASDPASFVRLTDSIIDEIDNSLCSGLEHAREILDRLKRRDFYTQLPYTVKVPVLPMCPSCNNPTPHEAAYCSHCGASTLARKRVKVKKGNFHVSLIIITELLIIIR